MFERWVSSNKPAKDDLAAAPDSTPIEPKVSIWSVIPRAVREAIELLPVTKLQVIHYEGRIEMIPVRSSKSLRDSLRGIDTSVPHADFEGLDGVKFWRKTAPSR